MRELRSPHRALCADEPADAREILDVLILPDAEVLHADPALGQHGVRLGEHHRRAADRELSEVHEVPVVGEPIVAEYWHIGETPMRLRSVTPRRASGSKRVIFGESY